MELFFYLTQICIYKRSWLLPQAAISIIGWKTQRVTAPTDTTLWFSPQWQATQIITKTVHFKSQKNDVHRPLLNHISKHNWAISAMCLCQGYALHKACFRTDDVICSLYCHFSLHFLNTHYPDIHMIVGRIQSVVFKITGSTMRADGRPWNGHRTKFKFDSNFPVMFSIKTFYKRLFFFMRSGCCARVCLCFCCVRGSAPAAAAPFTAAIFSLSSKRVVGRSTGLFTTAWIMRTNGWYLLKHSLATDGHPKFKKPVGKKEGFLQVVSNNRLLANWQKWLPQMTYTLKYAK